MEKFKVPSIESNITNQENNELELNKEGFDKHQSFILKMKEYALPISNVATSAAGLTLGIMETIKVANLDNIMGTDVRSAGFYFVCAAIFGLAAKINKDKVDEKHNDIENINY